MPFQFVPNAPCGVESDVYEHIRERLFRHVPNAPCGVERRGNSRERKLLSKFLMHRVELKENVRLWLVALIEQVPNAPCGVERKPSPFVPFCLNLFLMHRVELKEGTNGFKAWYL